MGDGLADAQPLTEAFAQAMERLGPFESPPTVAVAVSGGADSMALAVLARDWVNQRDGFVLGLVVDHGLRTGSADEARLTIDRLARLGLPARLLTLANLNHGPALAERARIMRYEALTEACVATGILHLLLGHHAADQLETLAMRLLRGSQTPGLAGMSALRETRYIRLLRPLLGIEPALLREFLTAGTIDWVEDPSNRNPLATRSRIRQGFAAASAGEAGIVRALSAAGRMRQREEAAIATELAARATIRPEGFALLSPGRIGTETLRRLIRTIGGAAYAPSFAQVTGLAGKLRPATVAGVRLLPAGRFGDGFLLVREEAAIGPPVRASCGAIWDSRFRMVAGQAPPVGATIEALGRDAARFRGGCDLPSAVLRTLPVIRIGEVLASVPHLGYACREYDQRLIMLFSPMEPAASACFVPTA